MLPRRENTGFGRPARARENGGQRGASHTTAYDLPARKSCEPDLHHSILKQKQAMGNYVTSDPARLLSRETLEH
jgi:hypothetical protein